MCIKDQLSRAMKINPVYAYAETRAQHLFFTNKDSSVIQNFKPSSVVVSDLVGTPVDRFSHGAA